MGSTNILYSISLALIVCLGLLNYNLPLLADQIVSLLAAQRVEAGGVLYVDFWDNKMPGLFWFYWLAGKLFSFDEFGIHSFELIWMLVFTVTMMVGLRRYFYFPWLSAFAHLRKMWQLIRTVARRIPVRFWMYSPRARVFSCPG